MSNNQISDHLKIPPIRPSALDVLLDGSADFIFVFLLVDHIQVRRDDVLRHPASIEVDNFFFQIGTHHLMDFCLAARGITHQRLRAPSRAREQCETGISSSYF